MYLAPFTYNQFFLKVFSHPKIAKQFLEDFFSTKIDLIQPLKTKYRATDDARSVEFDYHCEIDGFPIIVDMQQWYKKDVIQRFFLYHSMNTVLQLEKLPERAIEPIEIVGKKTIKVYDYREVAPVVTLVWMVDDSLGFKDLDYVSYIMTPEIISQFIKNKELWQNSEILELLKERNYILDSVYPDNPNLDFLSKNKLIYMLQENIVKNPKKRYSRWFEFAKKTREKDNTHSDFTEYETDPIFREIIRLLKKDDLSKEEQVYLNVETDTLDRIEKYNQEMMEKGYGRGFDKGAEQERRKAEKKSERKVRKEKLRIALNLRKIGLPIETIAQSIGLEKLFLDRLFLKVDARKEPSNPLSL